jgi:polyphosphate glucokinase
MRAGSNAARSASDLKPLPTSTASVLVIDVGGTHVKVLATGHRQPVRIDSGPHMTPGVMVKDVTTAVAHWTYDVISIGFPGPVKNGRPAREPWNLGKGWVGFDFRKAFKRPVRIINDAAMQALGSYAGGNMLFLGLGTGLGSSMIRDGDLIPLELAHLPYKHGKSYEEYLGNAGMASLGKHAWRRQVAEVSTLFIAALQVDYVVLGGGNARHLKRLPRHTRLGANANAFKGGFRLWREMEKKRPPRRLSRGP